MNFHGSFDEAAVAPFSEKLRRSRTLPTAGHLSRNLATEESRVGVEIADLGE